MPRKVDKAAKKQAIAGAAIGVFRQRGYHATRMADIARAAGIGKGTIYEYFRDKPEILRFAFDRYFDAFRQGALEALGRARTPGGRLLALVAFALEHVEAWRDHCAVYIDYFSVARTSAERLFCLDSIYGEMRALLQALITEARDSGEVRNDVDPEAAADLLISLYDGIILHDLFDQPHVLMPALQREALSILADGLFTTRPDKESPGPDRDGEG